MGKKKKTLSMLIGLILFIVLLITLFPFFSSEHFCCRNGSFCPRDAIARCGSYVVFLLPGLGNGIFIMIMLLAFIISIILTLCKKISKFIPAVCFSSLALPLIISLLYLIVYSESWIFTLVILLILAMVWTMPVSISFLSYRKSKITKEDLCSRIYRWLLPTLLLYPIYIFSFIWLILTNEDFNFYLYIRF